MQRSLRTLLLLIAPMMFSACATKGWVRNQMAAQRAYTDSAIMNATAVWNAQLTAERSARVASDSMLMQQTTELRAQLEALRTQFNARIALVNDALTFALPVTFAYDDATIRDENRAMVEKFARVARRFYPKSVITVEGFADPAGTARYNLELSRRRAENVKTMLASLGVPASHVRAVGYGKGRLVVPGARRDDAGAEANRRVTFVIESAGRMAAVALSRPLE